MRLYHFTAPYRTGHLGKIMADGQIDVTESNVSATQEHAGPDVVWLTSDGDPDAHRWNRYPGDDPAVERVKVLGRITVEVPDREVTSWSGFCTRHRVKDHWRRALTHPGWKTWKVIQRPIPREEWRAVEVYADGRVALDLVGRRDPVRGLSITPARRPRRDGARARGDRPRAVPVRKKPQP